MWSCENREERDFGRNLWGGRREGWDGREQQIKIEGFEELIENLERPFLGKHCEASV